MVAREEITVPQPYQVYLDAVTESDLSAALQKSTAAFVEFLDEIPKEKRDFSYAEGKWTLRQLLRHIIDAERVFAFRALWFARRSTTALPGFDENLWAIAAPATDMKWKKLVKEFTLARRSNEILFASFSEEDLKATGTSNDNVLSAAAFGFVAAGHLLHHINVIKQRYLKAAGE